jgi:threonine aldolase
VLVGSCAFVTKARWFRKLFGGGTRQAGLLAAAADYCLDAHYSELPRVHALATRLAVSLAELGADVVLPTETNMVHVDPTPLGFSMTQLSDAAAQLDEPVRISGGGAGGGRLVLHHQIAEDAVQQLTALARRLKTTGATATEQSLRHAGGEAGASDELNEASRPGNLRARHAPASTQLSPYRSSASTR